jgi:hypothetical protein
VAYGSPANPVSGTVITVAYATANILDPIRWLRLMTGNADPPGSSYVCISVSTSGVTWQKVPTDAIADGAITTPKVLDGQITAPKLGPNAVVNHLGYTPFNVAGGTLSGPLAISQNVGTNNNLIAMNLVNQAGGNSGVLIRFQAGPSTSSHIGLIVGISHFVVLDPNGVPSLWQDGLGHLKLLNGTVTVWDSSNSGASADVHSVQGYVPGTVAGNLAFYNGAGRVNDSENLGGHPPSFYSSAAGAIPSGLVAMVRTSAEIPSGWLRETRLDGRIPVGAGTAAGMTVSATFIDDQDYGSSWAHAHGLSSHTHGIGGHSHATPNHVHPTPVHTHATPAHAHATGALTITGATGAASATDQANTVTPATAFATGGHTHSNGTLDVGGTISGDGSGNTNGTDGGTTSTMTSSGSGTTDNPGATTSVGPAPGNTSTDSWVIPSHAYVFIRKT